MSLHRGFDRLRPIRRLSYEPPSFKFAPDLGGLFPVGNAHRPPSAPWLIECAKALHVSKSHV
jgi:hypothetical protein